MPPFRGPPPRAGPGPNMPLGLNSIRPMQPLRPGLMASNPAQAMPTSPSEGGLASSCLFAHYVSQESDFRSISMHVRHCRTDSSDSRGVTGGRGAVICAMLSDSMTEIAWIKMVRLSDLIFCWLHEFTKLCNVSNCQTKTIMKRNAAKWRPNNSFPNDVVFLSSSLWIF